MDASRRKALAGFLTRQAGADRVAITDAQLLTGGDFQENWRIRADVSGGAYHGPLDIVMRTDGPTGFAVGHGRVEEFALLKAAFAAGALVPEPLWLCADPAVMRRPFIVMRYISGTADGRLLVNDLRYGGDRTKLAERLGMELAHIHSIRPPRPDLTFLPRLDDPALSAIKGLRRHLDDHETPHPALEWGLRWLERHVRPREDLVLCHRDFRTGNYMVDEQGLTGILDFECSGWSDPWEDIGWFCAKCWRFGAHAQEAGGIGRRDDFYRGYEAISGRTIDPDGVRYWELMAHVAWAVIAIHQTQLHPSGAQASLSLALTGHIVPQLEYEILTMTEHV